MRITGMMTCTRIAAFLLFLVAGCATSQQVQRLDRSTEYSISCWYFGWYICYNKAAQLCPDRYKVLSENEGFSGRELRIACADAK
jgi:hypothetical protein